MIYEQLTNYCDCSGEITQQDVDELVSVISTATCWARKPCESFLFSERSEVIDLPNCMDCPFVYVPFYYPFDHESFHFYVVKQEGITEEVTEITDFFYSAIDENFKIDLGLPSCSCFKCTCGCEPVYKLKVTYEAGYEEIPECLLPVFCSLAEIVHRKNICECACETCESCTNTYPTQNPNDGIKYYEGDALRVQLQTELAQALVKTYKRQLAMMSLCDRQMDLWGFVV